MFLLIAFAFIAGIVTVLSPCILPLLPIILSSADGKKRNKPVGVVAGFVGSFTFFTLFLSSIVRLSGIPAESLRFFSVAVLALFGATLLIPQIQTQIELLLSRLANKVPTKEEGTGFVDGVLIGLSLGLLWTPCVGPILASVISLAITGTVTAQAFLITFAYALGTAIPMFMIMLAGSRALQRVPWLLRNTSTIQKAFGVLMIATAIGIFLNVDRRFQTFILNAFPNYGVGLTKIEDNAAVKQQLEKIQPQSLDESLLGKPISERSQTKGIPAPELIPGGQWFNSEALQLSELKGKVVLIDFWTYSCINCQRTFPALRQWHEKYKENGLIIIGVHAPEFEFEKNPKNVQQAILDFELNYPVVQDNDFATWRAYENRYWPAKYLIDKDGNVRYTHFGEGKYDETEAMIQQLLEENGENVSKTEIKNPRSQVMSRTPELYLGSARIEYLASPEIIKPSTQMSFTKPKYLPGNSFAYTGNWLIQPEFAAPSKSAQLFLNFEAKEVFLVARPKDGTSGQMKVSLDDQVQAFGADNKDGTVTVDSDSLYKLIQLPLPGKHELKIEFLDSNLEVYAFTFG